MKKTMSIVLAVFIALLLSVSAFAISAEDAKKTAYEDAGFTSEEGLVFQPITKKDGKYSVEFIGLSNEYEYDIHAENGKILKASVEYPVLTSGTAKNKTADEAKQLAFDYYGKSRVKAVRVEYDQNDNEYEVEFIDGEKQVEINVSAFDGSIREYEYEIIPIGNDIFAKIIALIKKFIAFLMKFFGK